MTEQEIKKNIDSLELMTDATLLFFVNDLESGSAAHNEIAPIVNAYMIFDRLEKCELTDENQERVKRIGVRLSAVVTLMDTINKERGKKNEQD